MQTWANCEIETRTCFHFRCQPEWRLDARWSEGLSDYDLWHAWDGYGEMRLRDGRTLVLRPGTTLWMRPAGLYLASHDRDRPLGVTALHFDLRPRPRDADLPPEVLHSDEPTLIGAAVKRVHDLARPLVPAPESEAERRELAGRWLRLVLLDLARSTARLAERPDVSATDRLHRERLAPVLAALREDPLAYDGVSEMARAARYSRDHFGRVFRTIVGQSPQDYLLDRRIEAGCRLLLETSLSVSEVADALDYASIFLFTRQFRQRTGTTPTDYRRTAGRAAQPLTDAPRPTPPRPRRRGRRPR